MSNKALFSNSYAKTHNLSRFNETSEFYRRTGIRLNGPVYKIAGILSKIPLDDPLRNEVLIFLIKCRPFVFSRLVEETLVSDDDIIDMCKNDPEVFMCIPPFFYENHPEIIEILAEKGGSMIYDFLPRDIRKLDIVKEGLQRTKRLYSSSSHGTDKDGFNQEWRDKDGNLKHYFSLKGNFNINSKEDYIKIVEKFISEGISAPSFCKKYGISSLKGFKELLERVKEENLGINIKQRITSVNKNNSERFVKTVSEISNEIANGSITIEDYFKDYYRASHKYDHFMRFGFYNNKEQLLKMIINYIKDNTYAICLYPMMQFFSAKNALDLATIIMKEVKRSKLNNSDTVRECYSSTNILKKFMTNYNRKTTIGTLIINDVRFEIDDDILDQIIAYIKSNDLYICQYVVNTVARKIVLGEIDFMAETDKQKEEMKNEILLMDKINEIMMNNGDIEEYFELMEEESKKSLNN